MTRLGGRSMNRRQVLVLFGGAAASPLAGLPLAALAQPGRVPRVGLLMLGNPDPGLFLREITAGLRELGYEDGRNIALDQRNAQGSAANLDALARQLAKLPVEVLVGFQTPSVVAAKAATTQVPIVMCPAADPIATGLVQSFARPGGNVTGVTSATAELAAKMFDLIREVLPSARRIGVVGNALDPFHKPFLEHVAGAARTLNFEIKSALSQGVDRFAAAFDEVAKVGVQALMVQPSLPRGRAAE